MLPFRDLLPGVAPDYLRRTYLLYGNLCYPSGGFILTSQISKIVFLNTSNDLSEKMGGCCEFVLDICPPGEFIGTIVQHNALRCETVVPNVIMHCRVKLPVPMFRMKNQAIVSAIGEQRNRFNGKGPPHHDQCLSTTWSNGTDN